jgi:hypothetical protein
MENACNIYNEVSARYDSLETELEETLAELEYGHKHDKIFILGISKEKYYIKSILG